MPTYSAYNSLGASIETGEITDDQVTAVKLNADAVGEHIVFNPESMTAVIAGTWAISYGALCGYRSQSNGATKAQNDEINFKAWLGKGDYDVYLVFNTNADRGICHVQVDGTDIGTIDTYAAAPVSNVLDSISAATVATSGLKTIGLKMATKHASASAYMLSYCTFIMVKVA